jgi:hypothetical protein
MQIVLTENNVSEINDYLHDAIINAEAIKYSPNDKTLKISLSREGWESKTEVTVLWITNKAIVPYIKCELNLNNVIDYEIEYDNNFPESYIRKIFIDKKGNLIISSTPGFILSCTCNLFDGQLSDKKSESNYCKNTNVYFIERFWRHKGKR